MAIKWVGAHAYLRSCRDFRRAADRYASAEKGVDSAIHQVDLRFVHYNKIGFKACLHKKQNLSYSVLAGNTDAADGVHLFLATVPHDTNHALYKPISKIHETLQGEIGKVSGFTMTGVNSLTVKKGKISAEDNQGVAASFAIFQSDGSECAVGLLHVKFTVFSSQFPNQSVILKFGETKDLEGNFMWIFAGPMHMAVNIKERLKGDEGFDHRMILNDKDTWLQGVPRADANANEESYWAEYVEPWTQFSKSKENGVAYKDKVSMPPFCQVYSIQQDGKDIGYAVGFKTGFLGLESKPWTSNYKASTEGSPVLLADWKPVADRVAGLRAQNELHIQDNLKKFKQFVSNLKGIPKDVADNPFKPDLWPSHFRCELEKKFKGEWYEIIPTYDPANRHIYKSNWVFTHLPCHKRNFEWPKEFQDFVIQFAKLKPEKLDPNDQEMHDTVATAPVPHPLTPSSPPLTPSPPSYSANIPPMVVGPQKSRWIQSEPEQGDYDEMRQLYFGTVLWQVKGLAWKVAKSPQVDKLLPYQTEGTGLKFQKRDLDARFPEKWGYAFKQYLENVDRMAKEKGFLDEIPGLPQEVSKSPYDQSTWPDGFKQKFPKGLPQDVLYSPVCVWAWPNDFLLQLYRAQKYEKEHPAPALLSQMPSQVPAMYNGITIGRFFDFPSISM